ncbi:MAG: GGDEF domain-containing protein, partial [Candidatus Limnocylindrales bacterium]
AHALALTLRGADMYLMSRRRLTPMLAVLLVLLCAVVSALVASERYFQGRLLETHGRAQIVVRDTERIRYYDLALSDEARLAGATEDISHERRYHELVPELDKVIAEVVRVADSQQVNAALNATKAANQALIKMEERSFILNKQNRGREALALLTSAEYLRQKLIYAQGFERANAIMLATVRADSERVRSDGSLALLIGGLLSLILLAAGVRLVHVSGQRERLSAEQNSTEADRRAKELAYFETQQQFSDVLQVTRGESEAHNLVKRHLERTIPGASVAVLNRNNSDNRLQLMTDVREASTLPSMMQHAKPDSCMAIRLGRAHARDEQVAPLLECEICGTMAGSSLCTPSLVGGEVIGSVLIERPDPIDDDAERRVQETVGQAAPVLANLRNLAISESRALTDALTGLANKRSAQDTLKRMSAHAGRTLSPLAAVMLDLDHFKQINDLFGHECGDEVLAAVGSTIAETLRESDFAARYGGEEFLLLLPDTDREAALEASERLRTAIGALRVPGENRNVTASLGIAVLPDDAGDSMQLRRRADQALYAAKRSGRNRVESWQADVLATSPRSNQPD